MKSEKSKSARPKFQEIDIFFLFFSPRRLEGAIRKDQTRSELFCKHWEEKMVGVVVHSEKIPLSPLLVDAGPQAKRQGAVLARAREEEARGAPPGRPGARGARLVPIFVRLGG